MSSDGCGMNANGFMETSGRGLPSDPRSVLRMVADVRRVAQHFLNAQRQLVGMRQQQTHLPELLLTQGWADPWHAGEPDTVFRLPVGLSYGIIAHTVSLKELRRFWKHAF